MTDERDALERELAGLQPRPLSEACQQRIGAKLSEPQKIGIANWMQVGLVAAGTLMAAAVLLAFFGGLFGARLIRPAATARTEVAVNRERRVSQEPSAGPMNRVAAVQPTVAAYWHAFAESTDAFDDLINRQAAREGRLSSVAGDPTPLVTMTRSWLNNAETSDDR